MTIIILLIVIAIIVALGVFFRRRSKAQSRWGLGKVFGGNCPRCGTAMPAIRKPASMQQVLWGGWTCPSCGAEVDKYGREKS